MGGDELLQGDVPSTQGVARVLGQRYRDQEDEQHQQVDEHRAEDGSECGGGRGGAAAKQVVALLLVERHLAFQL